MQRGSVLPLLLIFGLVVAIGVGVFYNQHSRTNTSSQAAAPQLLQVFPSPSPKIQIVSDDLIGLQFEIPAGFNLIKETEPEYFKRENGDIRKNFNYYVLYSPAEFAEASYILPDGEKNLDKAILTFWVFKNPSLPRFLKNSFVSFTTHDAMQRTKFMIVTFYFKRL